MSQPTDEIEHALRVFVQGFCAGRSATHPYEYLRVGKLWVMRDGPRKNAKLYRKEEWIAYDVPPREVDAAARKGTRGRFFVCAVRGRAESDDELRAGYKALGYRLLATEPLFVHRLKRILGGYGKGGYGKGGCGKGGCGRRSRPQPTAPATIERVLTTEMAARLGTATRLRPIAPELLVKDAPFRQYVALDDGELVGWVRSVNAADSSWCANMYVRPTHRRRGIGRALLAQMLKDDRRRGAKQSVLLSSHTGALVYPRVGYEQIGLLSIFAPKRK